MLRSSADGGLESVALLQRVCELSLLSHGALHTMSSTIQNLGEKIQE